jgi:D-lyxose ketol-isomerase
MTSLSSLFSQGVLNVDYVKVSDVKAYNVGGGTFTQDAWRTRNINTEDSDASGICTIDSDQITLEAGTYICTIFCPAFKVNNHKAQLYNITDSETTLYGVTLNANATYNGNTHSVIMGKFTIAAQKTFEIQHYCTKTCLTSGFGLTINISGINSVYTVAEFLRIKDLSKAFSEVANYVKVSDVKDYNTSGGTFTSGAWRTRDIGTEDSDSSNICTIDSNQITLAAGTYICNIICPAYQVDSNVARLYNISDSSEVLLGTVNRTQDAYGTNSFSKISGKFTIATEKIFEVQHSCVTTEVDVGFGIKSNISDVDSVYTIAEFFRVAT